MKRISKVARLFLAPERVGSTLSQQNLIDKLAVSILAREGVAAIWALHVAAAEAHRTGHPNAAAAILEIAEAAENRRLNVRLRGRLADAIGPLA